MRVTGCSRVCFDQADDDIDLDISLTVTEPDDEPPTAQVVRNLDYQLDEGLERPGRRCPPRTTTVGLAAAPRANPEETKAPHQFHDSGDEPQRYSLTATMLPDSTCWP